jgi:hypothetical protein
VSITVVVVVAAVEDLDAFALPLLLLVVFSALGLLSVTVVVWCVEETVEPWLGNQNQAASAIEAMPPTSKMKRPAALQISFTPPSIADR